MIWAVHGVRKNGWGEDWEPNKARGDFPLAFQCKLAVRTPLAFFVTVLFFLHGRKPRDLWREIGHFL